ncbi:hypothetical protein SJ05684_b53000 (plasmid) [Sinorhizobium sojae CCBAU 05684]|uniref:Uncharacterized protein n=1 Tax=Sinorhizobium sojae CCBAU 05684 TaxID=716928 RepID=A0A249PKL0_9HYPH|nr:hypothetical protein SJ05684_b53000 [Sinorhizobium sojae CCBAU 05684]
MIDPLPPRFAVPACFQFAVDQRGRKLGEGPHHLKIALSDSSAEKL